jgi:hypothetical protein
MKLTKEDLVKIIKEELGALLEFASPSQIDQKTDPYITGGARPGTGIYKPLPGAEGRRTTTQEYSDPKWEEAREADIGTGSPFEWFSPSTWFGLEETIKEELDTMLREQAPPPAKPSPKPERSIEGSFSSTGGMTPQELNKMTGKLNQRTQQVKKPAGGPTAYQSALSAGRAMGVKTEKPEGGFLDTGGKPPPKIKTDIKAPDVSDLGLDLEEIIKEEFNTVLNELGFGEGTPAPDELSKKRVVYLEEEEDLEEDEKKTKVSKSGQKRVSKKIGHLVGKEGKSQEQSAAIAYSMENRGELKKGGKHSVG